MLSGKLCFSLSLSLSLCSVHLFVRWHYAEVTGDRRGYESALAALSPELRSSWVDRQHNRGCLVLCSLLLALRVDRGMPFSIARRWCSFVLVVTSQERIFSLMRLSRCLHLTSMFCVSLESVGRLLQPLGAPRGPDAARWRGSCSGSSPQVRAEHQVGSASVLSASWCLRWDRWHGSCLSLP